VKRFGVVIVALVAVFAAVHLTCGGMHGH